jgi:ferredoxin-type protein NapH
MSRGSDGSILPHPAVYAATFTVTAAAWSASVVLWSAGQRAFAVSAFLLGLSLGPCLTAYATAPRAQRQLQRRIVLFTGGLSILAPALLAGRGLDLEDCFALLLAGIGGAAVGHTLVTVVLGPLVLGRVLCGWGCWRAMVLELLPVGHAGGRRSGFWSVLPYAGLATSAGASVALHALGRRPALARPASALAAIGVYYVASIGLAFALRDARAFCKYLCPSGAILRWTSRPALLRIAVRADACDGCGACSRVCPMDVDVAAAAVAGRGIGHGDCVLCQRCVQACTRGALRLTFGGHRGQVLHSNMRAPIGAGARMNAGM